MADRWRPPAAVWASAGLHAGAAGLAMLRPGWWPGLLGAVAANHAALGVAGMLPRCAVLGPVLSRLPGGGRVVGLTFDDGPDPAVTPCVLDLLAAAGVRASFFCIGARARAHPALLRRMVAEGHRVENHSMTHPLSFATLAGKALRGEVLDAQAALAEAAGVAPGWFRPPMGFRSPLLGPVLARAGLGLATWSRRGFDTRDGDPAAVLRRLRRGLGAGDVLLLHDGNAARAGEQAVVLAVLPALLAGLRAAGLSAVPLPIAGAAAAGAEAGSPASTGYASR